MNTAEPTFSPDPIPFKPQASLFEALRARLREAIEITLEEELEAALGAAWHERSASRRGFRNGALTRDLLTEHGPTRLTVPRGRILDEDGLSREWRSEMLPRYQRRTRKVDEALLGAYLAGANTRRIRKALQPLLGEKSMSRSSISRVIGRLKAHFEAWRSREVSSERYVYLYMDALRLPVRMAKRVVKVPVQAALGVDEEGRKVLLSLEIASSESTASWKAVVHGLTSRGLCAPQLVILDGNAGLCRAVHDAWPETEQQRCTKHKLENLLAKAPKHAHGELKRDYRAITHPESPQAARKAYQAFLVKWRKLAPEVARSLEEAGEDLLSFTRFPKSQWKSLRTTNQIERINGEFRRRTKTQGSFRNEASALVLLYGLVALGQIGMRKIDGWRQMPKAMSNLSKAA